jgi:hypothetical protein
MPIKNQKSFEEKKTMKNNFKNMLAAGILTSVCMVGSVSAKDGLMFSDFAGGDTQSCAAVDAEKGGLMLSDRAGLMLSDRAGLLISDFVSAAASSVTGIIIVGRSGILMSDFAGETPICPQ